MPPIPPAARRSPSSRRGTGSAATRRRSPRRTTPRPTRSARATFGGAMLRTRYPCSEGCAASRHHDDVAGADAEVLLHGAAGPRLAGDFLEIEWKLADRVPLPAKDRDPSARRILAQTSGHRQNVKHRRPAPYFVAA